MTKEEKQKYVEYLSLEKELRSIEERGTELYLNGKPSGADAIAQACVFCEDADYSREYFVGSGRLRTLHFNGPKKI